MLLSVEQVARILNVGISCVYWLLRAGRLEYFRIGFRRGKILVDDSDLEAFIRKNTIPCRRKGVPGPRIQAKSAFTHLNGSRMRQAWDEQAVEQPVPRRSPCAASVQRDAGKPS